MVTEIPSMCKASDVRYVAYFDMLGMGGLSVTKPDLAWEAVCQLHKDGQERLRLGIQIESTGKIIRDRLRWFTFSDSIIVFTCSDQEDDIYAIILLAIELFSLPLHHCIPMRGGIAHGRFLFSLKHGVGVGPALVHAHHLSEEAQWLGICVDQEVCNRAASIPIQSERQRPVIIPWSVPLKDGKAKESLVIDWVETHRDNFSIPPPIGVAQFYQPFERFFGPFEGLPDNVRAKYDNTVKFVNDRLLQ